VENIPKFLYELGQLKRFKRTGWINAGIADPESIADHTFRSALIGWILADMEKADANKVLKLVLIHDIPESRIGDLTIVNRTYIKKDEEKAMKDMCSSLPSKLSSEFISLFKEYKNGKTLESRIAKDADKLDMYIQARENEDIGYSKTIAKEWKEDAFKQFTTESAKKLAQESEKVSYQSWWDFIYKK
jgi:putative hydrolase of HD superfamily